jgi:hypothetical protein
MFAHHDGVAGTVMDVFQSEFFCGNERTTCGAAVGSPHRMEYIKYRVATGNHIGIRGGMKPVATLSCGPTYITGFPIQTGIGWTNQRGHRLIEDLIGTRMRIGTSRTIADRRVVPGIIRIRVLFMELFGKSIHFYERKECDECRVSWPSHVHSPRFWIASFGTEVVTGQRQMNIVVIMRGNAQLPEFVRASHPPCRFSRCLYRR